MTEENISSLTICFLLLLPFLICYNILGLLNFAFWHVDQSCPFGSIRKHLDQSALQKDNNLPCVADLRWNFLTIHFNLLKFALFLLIISGFTFIHFGWFCVTAVDLGWSWFVLVDIRWSWRISVLWIICLFTNINDIGRQSVKFQIS